MLETQEAPSIFTATSAVSLAGVLSAYLLASAAARRYLPRDGRWQDKTTFIWLVRPAIHQGTRETLKEAVRPGVRWSHSPDP